MSELGRLLKQGREAQGLTLGDTEHSTHIRRTYLAALEEGRHDLLPDLVYTRGLVLNYARYLGLDTAEASRLFQEEYGRPLISSKEIGSHQPLAEPLRLAGRGWVRPLIAVLVLGAIAFALWWYLPVLVPWGRWLLLKARAPIEVAVARVQTATPTATLPAVGTTARARTPALETTALAAEELALPTSAALSLPTPTTFETETPTAPVAATPTMSPGLHLTLSATSPTWTRVTVDGSVVYEGTMASGDSREFTAQESLLLHTGNAGGTKVVLNDDDLGAIGASGEVVRRLWLWRDGIPVEATPEA